MPNTELDDFKQFFTYISTHFTSFDPNVITCLNLIDLNLKANLKNFDGFLITLQHLIKEKLYLYVPTFPLIQKYNMFENFYPHQIYKNYIIPLAVFMHYYEVNVKEMANLCLFIIPHQIYVKYYPDHAGEYFQGTERDTNKPIHSIFIKEFANINLPTRRSSLTTLFHEATHLIDNINFDAYKTDDVIHYDYQWHEIHAHYKSEVFYRLYSKMLSKKAFTYKSFLIQSLNNKCAELDSLYVEINELNCLNEVYLKHSRSLQKSKLLKQNSQYTQSMHIIQDIQKRFYRLIEELE